jgi:hypothetical protein
MMDRMRMRRKMRYSMDWTQSRDTAGEPPDCVEWRERAGYMEVDEENPILERHVCRSMRAFVGRKPFNKDL